ncbi:MAG: RseA family anti-sigma factor [Gammaproteobacteria bacterium]
MHEDLIQKISQLLDDELPQEEALSLLQNMRTRSELADKMRRYEAISQVLKNEPFLSTGAGFAEAVSRKIQSEPTYLMPDANRRFSRSRQWTPSHKIAAAAASVAVIAFIAHTQRPQPRTDMQVALAKPPADHAPKAADVEKSQPSEAYPVNQQINDYLHAHNSSVYTNGQANFQPYAQVTRYSQK